MFETIEDGIGFIDDLRDCTSLKYNRDNGTMPSLNEIEWNLSGQKVSFDFVDGMIKAGVRKNDAFLLIDRKSTCITYAPSGA